MTEKRFTIADYNQFYDNGKLMTTVEVGELLNALHEENLTLRVQLNLCSDQRNEFHRRVRENVNRVGKLEKENEQLKQQLKNLRRLANEVYMEGSE